MNILFPTLSVTITIGWITKGLIFTRWVHICWESYSDKESAQFNVSKSYIKYLLCEHKTYIKIWFIKKSVLLIQSSHLYYAKYSINNLVKNSLVRNLKQYQANQDQQIINFKELV